MTENEAKEVESILRQLSEDEGVDGYFASNLQCFFADGANAIEFLLEEIQAYRAIGTVEEFEELLEYRAIGSVDGIKGSIETNYVLLHAYEEIGTIEEFKALKEKKSEWKYSRKENIATCKNCSYEHYLGTYHQYATNYCPKCGCEMKT